MVVVRCNYSNELVDGPPARYRFGLELIKLSLAMNDRWSAIFSEKLNANVNILKHPEPSFCELVFEKDATVIDPFQAVRTIVDKCSHSGMYVKYGVKLLQHSAMCFFQRVTIVHLSVVMIEMHNGPNSKLEEFLKLLIVDYQTVADKLSVMGVSLVVVLKLAMLFEKVLTQLPTSSNENPIAKETKTLLSQVNEMVKSEFEEVCGEQSKDWWDEKNNTLVNMKNWKKSKRNKENPDLIMDRINKLRVLMRRVFDNILAEGMPSNAWEMIFTKNVFIELDNLQIFGEIHAKTEIIENFDF